MKHRRREENHESRQRRRHDELLPEGARQKSNHRLGQPADADDARRRRQGVLDNPREAAGQHPRDRATRQRHIHDDDEHEIQRRSPTHEKARYRRLQRERQRYRDENAGSFHSRAWPASRAASSTAAGGGVTTTRTASTEE